MSKYYYCTEYHFEPKINIDFGGSALLVLRLGFAVRVLKRPIDLGVKPKAEQGRIPMVRVVWTNRVPKAQLLFVCVSISAPCVSPCDRCRRFFSGEYPAAVAQLLGNSSNQIHGDRVMLYHLFFLTGLKTVC
jgi:hypothetical protein